MRTVPSPSKLYRFLAPSCLLALIFAAWSTAGCGGSNSATFCNNKCDCEQNCSTAARDTCTKTNEDNEKVATDVGCGAQADTFGSCVNDRGQCIGGKWDTGGCEVETNKLNQCLLSAKCAYTVDGSIHCL